MADDPHTPHPDDAETFRPWTADAEPVEVAPGVYLPSRLADRPEDDADLVGWGTESADDGSKVIPRISVGVRMELRDFAYALTRVEIQAHGDEVINGKLLRAIAVGGVVQGPVSLAAREKRADGKLVRYWMHDLRKSALDGPTDENLKSVARVYAIGHAMQTKPTAAVEDALGLKRSTAENWVRRAKDKGYVFAEA